MSIHNNDIYNPYVAHFNSAERLEGTNEDFKSLPIERDLSMFDRVSVVQTSIPRSIFNIPSNSNTFSIIENIEKVVSLRPGNYTLASLQVEVVRALNEVSSYTFNVSYPGPNVANTYRFTFTVSDNLGFQPKFKFYEDCWRQLGFNRQGLHTFEDDILTSINSIDLSFINRVFIKSDITSDNLLESILSYGSYPNLSIAYHYNNQVNLISKPFDRHNKNSWRFQLCDTFGKVVDLNGVSWHFDLIFYKSVNHAVSEKLSGLLLEKELFNIEQEIKNLTKKEEETPVENIETISNDVVSDNTFTVNEFVKDIEEDITYTQDIHKQFEYMDDKYEPRIFEETVGEELEEIREEGADSEETKVEV